MNRALLIAAVLFISGASEAEIYKLAVPSDSGLELHWWPVVNVPAGWIHDKGASEANGVNAIVPIGRTFSDAPAVIYARAIFKPRDPGTKSLTQLINDDASDFKEHFPGTRIEERQPIRDADGKDHRYFSFSPTDLGSWELVAYGEEGDFYLIFTVSGSTKAALSKAQPDFEHILATYKERL